jgi:hypothetical protein
MALPLTLILAATALALALFCGWRGARPPDPLRGPRLAPWQLLMMLFGAAVALLLVHAASLLGLRAES